MTMEHFTLREQIVEVINKLFVYTDHQQWDKLQKEVFTETVFFDMSSLGGDVGEKTAHGICEEWAEGFKDLDAVQHLAGNYLVTVNTDSVDVFAYATATHYKESATRGKTRDFVGSYNLHLVHKDKSWKINRFKYQLKYVIGNVDLS